MSNSNPKFVILTVLDGWGISAPSAGNAVSLANTINMNRYVASYPHSQISASGESVGLPRGEVGNTETGHLNLGAGRIVYQDLMRINMAIAEGTFFSNQTLLDAIAHAKKNNSNLHIMGLVGAGGVHSNLEHLFALIQLCSRNNFKIGDNISSKEYFALKIIEKVMVITPIQSSILEEKELKIISQENKLIRFPIEGDIDVLVGSLRLIFSRLNEVPQGIKIVREIDLRFANPVLR